MRSEIENFLRVLALRVSHTTLMRKAWQIKSFYKFLLYHNKHYTEVEKETVEKYLRSFNCIRSTRQQLCGVIREFYDFVKLPNPAGNLTFQKDLSKKLPRVPSQQVIQGIIGNCNAENTLLSLRNRLIVELAYGSGLRRTELVTLNIDDTDLENRTVFIQGKGGKNRIVPLTAKAVACMREYLAERRAWSGPLLVSFTGRRLTLVAVNKIVKDKLGIRPHQLRHACAGHMLKNGCDIRTIQELLGHKDLKTTQIYTHIDKGDLRDIINKNHPRNV